MTEDTPPHAVIMWSDDNWIYVALPIKDDVPYICKFAFTEGGLSKALYVLRNARKKAPIPSRVTLKDEAEPGHVARISHPKIKKAVPKTTEQQRAQATEVLRKLKMLRR